MGMPLVVIFLDDVLCNLPKKQIAFLFEVMRLTFEITAFLYYTVP